MTSKPALKKLAGGKPANPKTPSERLNAIGIETICERIVSGESITAIAGSVGLDQGSLRYWIASDPSRSVRAREARAITAAACDDEALRRIDDANDNFSLAKAKEAAHHLRWRASKIAPKEYGDKVVQEHTGADGGPIDHSITVSFVEP